MSKTWEHYHHAARHHEQAAYHYKEAKKYDDTLRTCIDLALGVALLMSNESSQKTLRAFRLASQM